ncbi:equilibrative nucleobase transporter 1-like [Oratosquilla oratoria]|uniref:equilibrative nucleobase transporter 1-like n=1 Tax=Oratosquilla oratoria TaxID=337810 RepID=UPI003F759372
MLCKQDPELRISNVRKVFIFLVVVFESILFGGAVFGWPQLVHVLKVEGVYSDLCQHLPSNLSHQPHDVPRVNFTSIFNNSRCHINDTYEISQTHAVGVERCKAQDERFALIYAVAVAAHGIPSILVGLLLHYVGLWVTRIMAGIMLSVGFICLGFVTPAAAHWLFPAMVFLALGGNQLRLSMLQFGDLFPAFRSTAISLLTGLYAASAGLFLVFQYSESKSVPRAHVCWILAAVVLVSILCTFTMPTCHIPDQDDHQNELDHLYEIPEEVPPLKGSLFTLSNGLGHYWFIIVMFAVYNFQQLFSLWVYHSSCSVKEAGFYTVLFTYSTFLTVFIAPLSGMLIDCLLRRVYKDESTPSRHIREIRCCFFPLLLTTVLVLGMYICILFFHPASVIVGIVCAGIAKPFVSAVFTTYVRIRFPGEHFNLLMGLYYSVMTPFLFLHYPHLLWSLQMYIPAHMLVLGLLALTLLNPLHLLLEPLIESPKRPLKDRTLRTPLMFTHRVKVLQNTDFHQL